MKKKVVALIMTTVMCTGFLMGCGSAQTENDNVETKTSDSSTSDGKEESVTIVSLNVNNNLDKQSEQRDKVHAKILEETGVDLQLVMIPSDQLTTQTNLMLSSKEQLDIVPAIAIMDAISLNNAGAVKTINKEELDKYPYLRDSFTEEAWNSVLVGDEYLGIPYQGAQTVPGFIQVRTDWVEALGKEMPATWDEYAELIKLFYESDLDGNGKDDTIPLIANSVTELEQAVLPFFTSTGAYWFWDEEEQTLKPYEMDDGYIKFLQTMQDWAKKGYLFNQIETASKQDKLSYVAQNRVGSTAGTWTRFLYNGIEVLAQSELDIRYEFVTPVGDSHAANEYTSGQFAKAVTLITSTCKNPEKALEFLNYQCSPEGQKITTYGFEGENYNVNSETGKYEIISDSPTDWSTAEYYILYNLHEGFGEWRTDLWPLDTYTYNLMNTMNNEIKEMKVMVPPDATVPYDTSRYQSASSLNDMDTLLSEAKGKILAGTMDVSEWDSILDTWLSIGGKQLMKDKTEQYLEHQNELDK